MRHERSPVRTCVVWLGVAALLFGCGDDSASSSNGSGSSSAGGDCPQAGLNETGCPCGAGEFGHRACTEDLVWSECLCPDYKWSCTEGETVTCTCPGERTERETKCLFGGWFKCPCEGSGGANAGGGTGGIPDPGDDAGAG